MTLISEPLSWCSSLEKRASLIFKMKSRPRGIRARVAREVGRAPPDRSSVSHLEARAQTIWTSFPPKATAVVAVRNYRKTEIGWGVCNPTPDEHRIDSGSEESIHHKVGKELTDFRRATGRRRIAACRRPCSAGHGTNGPVRFPGCVRHGALIPAFEDLVDCKPLNRRIIAPRGER